MNSPPVTLEKSMSPPDRRSWFWVGIPVFFIALGILCHFKLDRILLGEVEGSLSRALAHRVQTIERSYRLNRVTAEAFARDPVFLQCLPADTPGSCPPFPQALRRQILAQGFVGFQVIGRERRVR